jgi:hypothetical protein
MFHALYKQFRCEKSRSDHFTASLPPLKSGTNVLNKGNKEMLVLVLLNFWVSYPDKIMIYHASGRKHGKSSYLLGLSKCYSIVSVS